MDSQQEKTKRLPPMVFAANVRLFVGNGVAKLIERAVPEGTSAEEAAAILRISANTTTRTSTSRPTLRRHRRAAGQVASGGREGGRQFQQIRRAVQL